MKRAFHRILGAAAVAIVLTAPSLSPAADSGASASLGVYRQTPTYQEFRGKPEPGETILGALNEDIRSQRAVQAVAGVRRFLPRKRLFLRAEAFYRSLGNVISYDIENVRVRYSGENDATAYAYGIDLQIKGEFVPGLESWANYSFLVARERFVDSFVFLRIDSTEVEKSARGKCNELIQACRTIYIPPPARKTR